VLVEHFIGLCSESDLLGGVLLRRLDLSADFSQLSVFFGRVRSILTTTFTRLDNAMRRREIDIKARQHVRGNLAELYRPHPTNLKNRKKEFERKGVFGLICSR
jgi:hypothetical protein